MGKLYELLAVEGDLKSQAQRVAGQVKALFLDGTGKFLGRITTYEPVEEDGQKETAQITEIATTVNEQLDWIGKTFARWIDASIQKETTNKGTSGEVEINGQMFELPATALLNLESKLLELRTLYLSIPTNDVTMPWVWDGDTGCFVSARAEVRSRTKKVMRSFPLSEATPEHPAQVQTYNEDMLIGHVTTIKQSGMIAPKDKQARLDRFEELIRAVKQARQRANAIEVVPVDIGRHIFAAINGE